MIKLFKILFILKLGVFLLFFQTVSASEKIKIGLLIPMSGSNKEIIGAVAANIRSYRKPHSFADV